MFFLTTILLTASNRKANWAPESKMTARDVIIAVAILTAIIAPAFLPLLL